MADRKGFEAWDTSSEAAKVLAVAEQIREAYKNSVLMPANEMKEVEKGFAPSHLFFTDYDLYYSFPNNLRKPYVMEFLDEDERAPYRGFYKRTEVGQMFPEIITDAETPKPGDKLVFKRQTPVNIYQDESAPLEDWHLRNCVDWHHFDFSQRFLSASDYFNITTAVFRAMQRGNALVERAIVDYYLTSILGIYSYPMTDILFPLFTENDDYAPDEQFSKNARSFYLKTKEVKKRLEVFGKYITKYYKARESYLTNLNTHEVIGQALDKTIPKWDERLFDRSDKNKALEYVRECFMMKDNSNKYTMVGYTLRRQSLDAFLSAIFFKLDTMMKESASNWCGHKFGQDNKDKEAYYLQCEPQNLIVFMNSMDLNDALNLKGSNVEGPFTEATPIRSGIQKYTAMGVRFYGLDYILPSMCIVLDKMAFRIIEYFNKVYDQFHAYDLVDSKVTHVYKKLVLYRIVACNTLELAKGQKYAVPIAWGSRHLPFLRESS